MLETNFSTKQIEDIICKSNSSDSCYREYLEKTLYLGFGQIHEIDYEKNEFVKPSIVILSPTLETNEKEIGHITERMTFLLERINQYRKRYAIVHADKHSYIIGGYIFDSIKKIRIKPNNDFKYDPKIDQLQTIESLPEMIVSFGIATDGKYVVVIGGHTPSNKPLTQCYIMEIKQLPEKWLSLPDLPVPTSGPGVGMIDGEVHVIGGFDILSSESITHGEYYRLTFPKDSQWQEEKSLEQVRARSLVLLIPKENVPEEKFIYAAGGYYIDVKRHPNVVSTIYMCRHLTYDCLKISFFMSALDDEKEKIWKLITTIPDLKITHGLSFFEDKLHISEYDNHSIRTYNFKTNQWTELSKI